MAGPYVQGKVDFDLIKTLIIAWPVEHFVICQEDFSVDLNTETHFCVKYEIMW